MVTSRAVAPEALIADTPMSPFQWKVIAMCVAVAFIEGFDALTFGYAVPSIAEDWGISAGSLTPAVTSGLLGLILGAVTLGSLGDRKGRKLVTIGGTAIFGLFTLAIAFAPDVATLSVVRFLAGLGLGAVLPTAMALGVEYSPRRLKNTVAVAIPTATLLAGFLGGILASFIIPTLGWHSLFVVGGVIPLLIVPLLVIYLPESLAFLAARQRGDEVKSLLVKINPEFGKAELDLSVPARAKKAALSQLFIERRAFATIMLWLTYFCGYVMTFVSTSWMPTLLGDAGIDPTIAIWATSLLTFGSMIGTFALGVIVDRRGQDYRPLLVGFPLGILIIIGLVNVIHSPLLVLVFAALLGLTAISAGSALAGVAANLYPASARATGVSWALTLGRVGSLVGPLVVGILIQRHLAPLSIFLLGIVPAAIASVGMTFLVFRIRKNARSQAAIDPSVEAGTVMT